MYGGVAILRDYVIGNSMKIVKNRYPEYDDEKMEIIEYGLTGLYMLVTKSIIIFSIAYFIGIFTQLVIFMFLYNLIRSVSFGMHANSSKACLIGSALTFLSAAYVCKFCIIPINIRVIFGLISIIYIWKYAPADTEKRPIVSSKRRFIYKLLSISIAIAMVFCSLVISDGFVANALICSLIIQCAMISPILYKLTSQKYNNYRYYKN